ncbi:DUF3826 domain-containing protein [Sediminibacterium soli]|uniref:DUF3826 domain-containing protein n=1 Tax=Sediminibacterium soli TaxID=2698829 RepID=UPI0013797ABA|nr:DUF3826 domain-containing protein [Sediminibacterium soli]NCI48175.1 DUF3826 domain-containing protein [Sediminibacterium soli]
MKRLLLAGLRPNTVGYARGVAFRLAGILFYFIAAQPAANCQSPGDRQAEFRKVLTERSSKIIQTLSIPDSASYKAVLAAVVEQYVQLNHIHDGYKAIADSVKKNAGAAEDRDAALKQAASEKTARLQQLHAAFLAQLKTKLSDEQIEKIKDGMTYRVLPVTWSAYMDMLPALTEEQKKKMYGWLTEAREIAMDEGSSEKKHEVFGKYKGRINNYLSAAGYDMKKEGEEWQKRIREREAAKKGQSGNAPL